MRFQGIEMENQVDVSGSLIATQDQIINLCELLKEFYIRFELCEKELKKTREELELVEKRISEIENEMIDYNP